MIPYSQKMVAYMTLFFYIIKYWRVKTVVSHKKIAAKVL